MSLPPSRHCGGRVPELIPPEWLDHLPHDYERKRLANFLEKSLPGGAAKSETMTLDFHLTWELEQWVLDTADRFQSSVGEVIEIAVQLGRYFELVYPRTKLPSVPLLHAILPANFFLARISAADLRAAQILARQDTHVSRLAAALEEKGILFEMPKKEPHPKPLPPAAPPRPPQPIDDTLPRTRSRDYPHSQALAGDLVHCLFDLGLKRNQAPQLLINEMVATSRYIDANFPDQSLPTLREELLVKTLSLEKLAARLNRVLSALETLLVDLDVNYTYYQKVTSTLAFA